MVTLKNVSVSKTGRKIFENFSLEIRRGEHWVIQGDNGAGKTLLLQLIAGIIHPSGGQVSHSFIDGHDWDTLYRERTEKIHLIPTHWLQAFLSGYGGLFYQQRYYNMDNTRLPKVRDMFGHDIDKLENAGFPENFRIATLLDLEVTRLSNGQLKKVIILRQLIKNMPALLLLDYPYDGLDAASRTDFNGFLDDLATRFGIHIILVDHGDALPGVINKRLVLRAGKIDRMEAYVPKTPSTARSAPPTVSDSDKTGQPVVEMQNLTIAYSGKNVISNLSWRINRGERWALTGKNGSGKTTLFSLIYADHPMAYSQKVFLFGKRRGTGESIWDIKKRINYMGPEQIHFLDPQRILFTAREYILMQSPERLQEMNALTAFFDAGHYINQPVRFLSTGQLQMTLLLRFFLDSKELLLLDEPFQFLDPKNHARTTDYLNHFLDKDITLVMITHDERDVTRWTRLRKHL